MDESPEIYFNQNSEWGLYLALGFIMFGVSLGITKANFLSALKKPKFLVLGLFSQWVLLPFVTWLLILATKPTPGIACGMFLLAAVPGGNVSNFISKLAGGNVSLSIILTSVSTGLSFFLTPLIFGFWSSLFPPVLQFKKSFAPEPAEVMKTLLFLSVLPVSLGILVSTLKPSLAKKIDKPINILSGAFFLVFLAVAILQNLKAFSTQAQKVFFHVLLMNGSAFAVGWLTGKLAGGKPPEVKAISIETGIQNAGLALVLILQFFDRDAEAALAAALWGVWHIISGMLWGFVLRKFSAFN